MAENLENKVNENEEQIEVTVEKKLVALYTLQQIDSKIDKIRIVRGELPLEVQDLEDEIVGLQTRIENYNNDLQRLATNIANYKIEMKESADLIKKYEEQQNNVRNNREYDSLSKEIEFQSCNIQLAEKKTKESNNKSNDIKAALEETHVRLQERSSDLELKQSELKSIIAETEKEEEDLIESSKKSEQLIEDRLLVAYKRIRKSVRNGLAVVQIERDACGGCFNKIPPQHQLDIRMHKKIIVCEYCGRILIDEDIIDMYNSRNK